MDEENVSPINNQKILILFFLFFASVMAFMLYMAAPPKFPESMSNYTPEKEEIFTPSGQADFFERFSRFVNRNHGGLLVSREINRTASVGGNTGNVITVFQQQFKFLKKSLLVNLVKDFASRENLRYTIQNKSATDSLFSHRIEIDFLRNNLLWIKIIVESEKMFASTKSSPVEMQSKDELVGISKSVSRDKVISVEKSSPSKSNDTQMLANPLHPKLAVIIADFGNEYSMIHQFLALDIPLTFAVLPQMPYSTKTAELVHQKGRELLLQQPMEPEKWPQINPGQGAVFVNDSPTSLRQKMEANLQSVPYTLGINNYMGSAFTRDRYSMNEMMKYLKDKRLFFLNSKTSSSPLAKITAKYNEVGLLSRDIYLDEIKDKKHIRIQLYKAMQIALKRGYAIVIARHWPVTLETLQNSLSMIEKKGIELVKVSTLISNK